ncbi:MAG: U32 family peptidase [Desulfuromonadales bacterium]|nr:U32 family peptidase [Desulfuromonadales bacterium]
MRIISPVDHLAEAGSLLQAGAHELYGGFVPPEWRESYNLLASLNQRTFDAAQIDTEAELAEIIRLTHAAGCQFALTLNAPFYSDGQLPLLLDYLDRMVGIGIDGLILADLGLLHLIAGRYSALELHASTMAHISNSGSLRFYAAQGIHRAILPRHLTVGEMAAIAAAVPEVRCDAFLLVGKCPNTEGLCTFHHVNPDRIWPCEIPYEIVPAEDGRPSSTLQAAMARQASWAQTDRRHGCGLCAIPLLKRSGIHGLKLVGRGAPTTQKVRNILLAREFLTLAEVEADFNAYRRRAMAAHRARFGADCHPNICYYPELLSDEFS